MIYKLYAVQDTLIGFGKPFIGINEEAVKRDYLEANSDNPHKCDMRLFEIGKYDDSNGTITSIIPQQILGGE